MLNGLTSDTNKDQYRTIGVIFAGTVESMETGIEEVSVEDVALEIESLGKTFVDVSQKFRENGISGQYLKCEPLTDDDLKDELGMSSKMQRKSILAQLKLLCDKPLNTVAFALVTCEMTFTWKEQMTTETVGAGTFSSGTTVDKPKPRPSMEEVKQHANKLLRYECLKQVNSKMVAERQLNEVS